MIRRNFIKTAVAACLAPVGVGAVAKVEVLPKGGPWKYDVSSCFYHRFCPPDVVEVLSLRDAVDRRLVLKNGRLVTRPEGSGQGEHYWSPRIFAYRADK